MKCLKKIFFSDWLNTIQVIKFSMTALCDTSDRVFYAARKMRKKDINGVKE